MEAPVPPPHPHRQSIPDLQAADQVQAEAFPRGHQTGAHPEATDLQGLHTDLHPAIIPQVQQEVPAATQAAEVQAPIHPAV